MARGVDGELPFVEGGRCGFVRNADHCGTGQALGQHALERARFRLLQGGDGFIEQHHGRTRDQGALEGDEEGIAFSVDLAAAMGIEDFAQKTAVLRAEVAEGRAVAPR